MRNYEVYDPVFRESRVLITAMKGSFITVLGRWVFLSEVPLEVNVQMEGELLEADR